MGSFVRVIFRGIGIFWWFVYLDLVFISWTVCFYFIGYIVGEACIRFGRVECRLNN